MSYRYNDGKNVIKNLFTWVELLLTKAIPVVLKVYESVWIKGNKMGYLPLKIRKVNNVRMNRQDTGSMATWTVQVIRFLRSSEEQARRLPHMSYFQ